MKYAIQTVERLKAAAEPHWTSLALMGSATAAYDWMPDDDRLAWTGDPAGLFRLDASCGLGTHDDYRRLMRPGAAQVFDDLLAAAPRDGDETFDLEYELLNGQGRYVWVEDRGIVLRAPNGRIERIVGTVRIVESRKERESRLAWLAEYDELTGLLNRARLRERIDLQLQTGAGAPAAFLVVAVDGLAAINEAYGFDVADDVIAAAAARLASAAAPRDAIGRVGGNKFGVLAPGCAEGAIEAKAALFRDAVREEMLETRAGPVAATVSVGAVALPAGASTSEEAVLRAEEALARAKSAGRANFSLYDSSPERDAARRKKAQVGSAILEALRDDRLKIAYQPIVCARTGRVESYEALVRMVREDGSLVPAGEFIPVSEELGLVRELDRRVLELSIDALKRSPSLRLSVNVSGVTVGDAPWVEAFEALAAPDRSITSRLTVEVTETAALLDIAGGVRFVRLLREAGARVAIDDFGAGYTSFRNLQTLDINSVKIDGTFVKGIGKRPDNQAFVRTLVSLAKTFSLQTVAEWVGSAEDAQLLRAFGVDMLQGAHFGMPDMTPPWKRG